MVIRVSEILAAVLLFVAGALRPAAGAVEYTITDLGVLSGAPSNGASHPTAMNDLGQVCGYGDTTVATSSGLALADHAWLYAGSGALVDLGTLGPATGVSIATAINDTGTVVGYADSSGTLTRAFVYTQAGGMQDLGIYPGGQSRAMDVNNLGQILGQAKAADGTIHNFIYSASAPLRELDLGYTPQLINDSDLVVAVTGLISQPANVRFKRGNRELVEHRLSRRRGVSGRDQQPRRYCRILLQLTITNMRSCIAAAA